MAVRARHNGTRIDRLPAVSLIKMPSSEQKDYFSTQAEAYKKFRPHYPAALYEYLLNGVSRDSFILDCATGNGQAASGLARGGAHVVGIDLSLEQLSNAPRDNNFSWIQTTAETLPIADSSIDLIIVAQALHWFDFENFYAEVKRVMRPGGRIAVWTYSLLAACTQFESPIEEVIRWFYHDVVGSYWPAERAWVDDEYRSIPFPFKETAVPAFAIDLSWDRQDLVGYISSWSAVQLYASRNGESPMPLLEKRLDTIWPYDGYQIRFAWPLSVRVGHLAAPGI